LIPLTEILDFQPPKLLVRPGTALGAALRLLLRCLKNDVAKTTATVKGDYKPLVFILTDGEPTDDWESAAKEVRVANNPKIANICAIGCGPDIDTTVLHHIADVALVMPELSTETFRKMFMWLSASVDTVSTTLETGPGESPINLPPLPENVLEFAPRARRVKDKIPRQIFLHARCSRTKQPYLMKYRIRPDGFYDPVASHMLDFLEEGDSDLLPPVNSAQLNGCPACPYCENPNAAMCSCGTLFCASPQMVSAICPGCGGQLSLGAGRDFDISRIQG
jgi:uncharacterized protein YegL